MIRLIKDFVKEVKSDKILLDWFMVMLSFLLICLFWVLSLIF